MDSSSLGMAKTEAIKREVRLPRWFHFRLFPLNGFLISISHSTQPEGGVSETSKDAASDPHDSHETNEH